jgi:hypothetical protein
MTRRFTSSLTIGFNSPSLNRKPVRSTSMVSPYMPSILTISRPTQTRTTSHSADIRPRPHYALAQLAHDAPTVFPAITGESAGPDQDRG